MKKYYDGNFQSLEGNPHNLTVNDELNKIAANIAIGRNWAGVHYRLDYTQSLLLGEKIAIGILQEQALNYEPRDYFKCTIEKFDGSKIRFIGPEIETIS